MSDAAAPGFNDAEIRALDRLLVGELARSFPGASNDVLEVAARTSAAVGAGHSALDIPSDAQTRGWAPERIARVLSELAAWPAVGRGEPGRPLVLDRKRLYLRRYFSYEAAVARALLARAAQVDPTNADADAVIERLFSAADADRDQRAVVRHAARHRLTVVLGGPGSGKTYTVLRVLAALAASGRIRPDRVMLAAPTGKAAERLAGALGNGRAEVDALLGSAGLESRIGELPLTASTLHRLLGAVPLSTVVRHDAEHPLLCDALVVDEASMVDLPMFARLLEALPVEARLLLLGDPDQLASVEVGSVMAELARMAISDSPDEPLAGEHDDGARAMGTTTEFTLLRGCIRRLRGNHRSARGSSLPGLLDCVRRADSRGLAQTLQAGAGVEWLGDPGARNAALERALGWFAPMLGRDDPGAVLAGFSDARVLVALREGSNGARGWNEDIMRALGLLQTRGAGRADDALVRGTPLLITRNDPVSGLSNGDVVIAWGPRRGSRAEYVLSAGAQGGLQTLALDALPPHEPAFALTAHKAQGSEYRRVLVALPPDPHPLITREWLYTAFSRAREQLVVSATAATLDAGLAASSRRVSGLADALLMDR